MKTKPQHSFSSVLPVPQARRPPLISGRGCLLLYSKRGGNRWRPSSALDSPFARIRMQNALARQETSCDENTHREGERENRRGGRGAAGCSPTSRPTFRHAFVVSRARSGGEEREEEWMQFSTDDDDGDVEEEETFSAESSSLGGRLEPEEDGGGEGEGGEEGTEKEEKWTTAKLKLQQHQIGSSHEVRRDSERRPRVTRSIRNHSCSFSRSLLAQQRKSMTFRLRA